MDGLRGYQHALDTMDPWEMMRMERLLRGRDRRPASGSPEAQAEIAAQRQRVADAYRQANFISPLFPESEPQPIDHMELEASND